MTYNDKTIIFSYINDVQFSMKVRQLIRIYKDKPITVEIVWGISAMGEGLQWFWYFGYRSVTRVQYPKSAYGPYCTLNPIYNGVYNLVEIFIHISTTWSASLLVDQGVPEGTCSQVLQSTSVDL